MAIGEKKPVLMEADRSAPGGVAALGEDGKVPKEQLPDDFIPKNVATLGKDGKLEKSQRPDVDSIPTENSENPVQSGGVFSALQQKSNPNLLDNWYFVGGGSQQGGGQFPINRIGELTYKSQYAIDRWENTFGQININSSYITITADSSQESFMQQNVHEVDRLLIGRSITISALLADNTLLSATGTVPSKPSSGNIMICSSWYNDIFGYGIRIFQSNASNDFLIFQFDLPPGKSMSAVAVKLELGPVQTIAHKEGDKWVLNEIPNYAEQYLICQQYSLITGKFVGIRHSNPNLLDNWYFVDPINERGQTDYNNSNWSILYSIDRWALTAANYEVAQHKLTTSANYGRIVQYIESSQLTGKTVTFSVLIKEITGGPLGIFGGPGDVGIVTTTKPGLISTTFVVPEMKPQSQYYNSVSIMMENVGASVVIEAVKLELGDQQTLAHKEGDSWVLNDPPPNYAPELLKCQARQFCIRYGLGTSISTVVSDGNGDAMFPIVLPVAFKNNATLSYTGTLRVHGPSGYSDVFPQDTVYVQGNIASITVRGLSSLTAYSLDSITGGLIIIDNNL